MKQCRTYNLMTYNTVEIKHLKGKADDEFDNFFGVVNPSYNYL